MGLDMYMYRTLPGNINKKNQVVNGDYVIEFAYWRKHHELHDWMQRLYRKRGGTETFNCVPLVLSLDDLALLEKEIRDGEFSPDYYETWYHQNGEDMKFINEAREYIKNGELVYYDSWW